jgi:hypothetical protein
MHLSHTVPTEVQGRALVHLKMSASQKAILAADIITGKKQLRPTIGQLAVILGVCAPYIRAELRKRGVVPARAPKKQPSVIELWDRLSARERAVLVGERAEENLATLDFYTNPAVAA